MVQDPYKYFRVEARELLDQLGKGVLDLERGAAPELVAGLLRQAHTLKGAARVVRLTQIANAAHAIEGELAPLRESAHTPSRDLIDRLLGLMDGIAGGVSALSGPPVQRAKPAAAAARSSRTQAAPPEAAFESAASDAAMLALSEGLSEATRLIESIRRTAGEAAPVAEQAQRELRQAREAAEQLRFVSAGALSTPLERVARDAALELERSVDLTQSGGEVRIDARVLGVVQAALVQLVRNAVAHGIEPEQARRSAGKPPQGTLSIEVSRRGRQVVFGCRDDGRGVDIESIRGELARKGEAPRELQKLSAEELIGRLFQGGVSTSRHVTGISGRGVGLDVVREAAARLKGEVAVSTKAGEGTLVELMVPLTVASIETLVVKVSGLAMCLPLDAVVGAERLAPAQVAKTPQGASILHEAGPIPFAWLSRLIDFERSAPPAAGLMTTVIVRGETGVAALGVDRILGTENVAPRPLPELAPASLLVAGTCLDAEGAPRFVLDPDGLVAAARCAAPVRSEAQTARRSVLVVDDSLTTRMLEQSILESAGYQVGTATTGEAALEEARRGRYALFLVDVEMPGMDGFTFVEKTRSDPLLRDIPALLVTSRASAQDRQRGQEVGARGYVVKSEFDQAWLLARIKELVG